MQDPIRWNDLALFAAVARHGTLAGAAGEIGTSTATLSRRMTALEARMGRRLFRHGGQSYAMTEDGAALQLHARQMEAAATEVAQWQASGHGPTRVRISAGTWTAQTLATDIVRFWSPDAPWVPEFVHCDQDMDIARREIDIGIRNRRPEQPWLAGRRTATVHFAVYGRDGVQEWIGASSEAVRTPSARWVAQNHGTDIVTTVNDPRLGLALALAGVGRIVLPCFVGDGTDLARKSDPIGALTHEEWLVCHHEARHTPAIRTALESLAAYLTDRLPITPP
ncbi:transcriptional regulator, LysR family [Jannaschia faecimaris]|uniref:Transcriptional regulator, LysR family n=1 Tax=Jannaschia faecimaris TaxID=1244108 RepID=A0A1H3RTU6_9RHOB|nr:LysR family transcriptional regulator [Jannaschia faecimaris]SDZ28738.1 transcriptional regulator, LysR family [Jannaschia faecimaris]